MTTKEKILNEALNLFSIKGYSAVSVQDMASSVGIKAPSLYKHYKSKQDIFDAILVEMKKSYDQQVTLLQMDGKDATNDIDVFYNISEDLLIKMGKELFLYFLHDDYVCKFRKMLTIEQFRNPELSLLYSSIYFDDPLRYQSHLFMMIDKKGHIKKVNTKIMALQFYAPLYTLLTLCDRQPEREDEVLEMVEQHIKQFYQLSQADQ